MNSEMSPEMRGITDMTCRVFRLAETTWKKTPAETSAIFKKYNILEFITECYGILQLSSDQCALDDIEVILRNHVVDI